MAESKTISASKTRHRPEQGLRLQVNVCAATIEEQTIQGHSECEKSHPTDPSYSYSKGLYS
jgi:hypothetical protein